MSSTMLLLAASMVVGQAEEASPLPEAVAMHLQYAVGTWETESDVEGETAKGTYVVRWAPGRHCVLITFSPAPGVPEDFPGQMSGILGYDSATKQAIEKNFWSNGSHYTLCYDLSKPIRAKGVVEGEVTGVEKDGTKFTQEVRVERKGRESFVYFSKTADGEPIEVVFRRVARRGRAKAKPKDD